MNYRDLELKLQGESENNMVEAYFTIDNNNKDKVYVLRVDQPRCTDIVFVYAPNTSDIGQGSEEVFRYVKLSSAMELLTKSYDYQIFVTDDDLLKDTEIYLENIHKEVDIYFDDDTTKEEVHQNVFEKISEYQNGIY